MSDSVFVVGAGAVGTALARGLVRAGIEVIGVYSRSAEGARRAGEQVGVPAHSGELPAAIRDAAVVLVSVPDGAIAEVAGRVVEAGVTAEPQVWLHCAGGLPASALLRLRGHVRGVGTLHPALAFPPGVATEIPPGVGFAVEGDPAAEEAARELVAALGGIAIRVPAEQRAAYHAALVMASNCAVALLAEARAVLVAAGVAADRIDPLLTTLGRSALRAASAVGIDASLTGPIRRGDADTVQHHLEALAGSPDAARLYRELGLATLRLAARRPGITDEQIAALAELLADQGAG